MIFCFQYDIAFVDITFPDYYIYVRLLHFIITQVTWQCDYFLISI